MTQWPEINVDAPALAIEGLKFRYGAHGAGWTVDIPSFSVAAGEQVLLTGGSGAGKSTLLQLICGLLDAGEGKVSVAGREMGAMHGAERDLYRGRSIGMIFQTFNLLPGFTAAENVMAALMFSAVPRGEHKSKAHELLTELGIAKHEALVDELSVGQQQRVAVARAVACGPALVLADEPTASLDPENSGAAMELIRRVCSGHGAALLCVSHDPALKSAGFDRVVSLKEINRA